MLYLRGTHALLMTQIPKWTLCPCVQSLCACVYMCIRMCQDQRNENSSLSIKKSALAFGDVAVILCAATSTSYGKAI